MSVVRPLLVALVLALPCHADPRFADGATSTTLPFQLIDDQVYLQAMVDGRALTLMLDFGNRSMISTKAAAALGLEVSPVGAGSGRGRARAKRLELGAYGLDQPQLTVIDLRRMAEGLGVELDGIVGADAFERLVVTIDYAARRLTLTDPVAFKAPAGALRVPYALDGGTPVIEGEVDGMKGRFEVDPGSGGSVRLAAAFVLHNGLLQRYPRRHETTTGWTVVGRSSAYVTRAGWLKLGAAEVRAPVLELDGSAASDLGRRQVAGVIGGGALRRFTVSFDHAQGVMHLKPNAEHAQLEGFDRSGMWIKRDGEGLIVEDLMANGPAARSQVQESDRIVSVDGVPAAALDLLELRARLRELPKGTYVKMALRRDGKPVHATIVLDDLVPPP